MNIMDHLYQNFGCGILCDGGITCNPSEIPCFICHNRGAHIFDHGPDETCFSDCNHGARCFMCSLQELALVEQVWECRN
jgi:hypothetical protein